MIAPLFETRAPARIAWISILLCGLTFAGAAWAGPPFDTNDPGIPPLHGWEINTAFVRERHGDERDSDAPLVDMNFGATPNLQLSVEIPRREAFHPGSGRTWGIGDGTIGAKWRFAGDSRSHRSLAVFPQVLVPVGDPARSLGDDRLTFLLPLIAEFQRRGWTLDGNLGRGIRARRSELDFWFGGILASRKAGKRLSLGAELFGSTPEERGASATLGFKLGGTFEMAERSNLLMSVGRSVRGDDVTALYLGWQRVTR